MPDLFVNPDLNHTSILLIDASGSVITSLFNNNYILEKIKQIVIDLDETEFRVLFGIRILPKMIFSTRVYLNCHLLLRKTLLVRHLH